MIGLESDKTFARPLAEPFDEAALLTEPWDLKATWASSGGLIQVDVAGEGTNLGNQPTIVQKNLS